MFTPCQKNEIVDIVRLQVKTLVKMLANNSITIEVTDKAVEWIAQEGYDPHLVLWNGWSSGIYWIICLNRFFKQKDYQRQPDCNRWKTIILSLLNK